MADDQRNFATGLCHSETAPSCLSVRGSYNTPQVTWSLPVAAASSLAGLEGGTENIAEH
jgi:hypothetical protein